jgi:hypothetical protein
LNVDEQKLKTLLLTTDLPVTYRYYKTPPALPYLVYLLDDTDNFGADDKVYQQEENYIVELYTEKHDPTVQAKMEKLFDDNDIYWEKTETWIESEKMYLTGYYI